YLSLRRPNGLAFDQTASHLLNLLHLTVTQLKFGANNLGFWRRHTPTGVSIAMTTSLPAWHRRAPIGRASSRKDIAEAALPAEDRAAVDPAGGTRDPEALRIGA